MWLSLRLLPPTTSRESVLGPTEFFVASSGALVFALSFQVWRVIRALPESVRKARPKREVSDWVKRSFKMWLAALTDTTAQYLEVVVIGLVLGPTVAAFYFVATRITNVFAMISGSITIYATPQISRLFHANAKQELQVILRVLAIISSILVAAMVATIVAGGHLLLWFFGTPYELAYPALIVLTAGAAVGALAGPAAYVLLLTGNEGAYPRIMASGLLLRFALIAILGPIFGLMGAAIAWSVSAVVIALILTVACRRLVGLDPSLGSALPGARSSTVQLTGAR